MAFTGKATYSAGPSLPETVEDVSDLIGIISPYETPLLNALGDPLREVTSTLHEWLEDNLLPSKDKVFSVITIGQQNRGLVVEHKDRFRVGDQLQIEDSEELMIIEAIEDSIVVQRGYAGTQPQPIQENSIVNIIGNPSVENRFIARIRCGNYTQEFKTPVVVNGSDIAASQLSLADEVDYQKQERLRELLRSLENAIINETPDPAALEHSNLSKGTWKRKIKGIVPTLKTNIVDAENKPISRELIDKVLKQIWEGSAGNVDLIVVGDFQKRQMNNFLEDSHRESLNIISVYESDFGICRIVVTRWMPPGAMLFLDSSRISVMPLAGHSFHFKPFNSSEGIQCGELLGEYTLEFKNEAAHGIINGLEY